jgi:hypothetical protein
VTLKDPEFLKRAWFIVGQCYRNQENFRDAENSFRHGQQGDSENADIWLYQRVFFGPVTNTRNGFSKTYRPAR